MKKNEKIYQSLENPDKGFFIQKSRKRKWDNIANKLISLKEWEYSLWVDECEGGEAYIEDWTHEDTFSEEKDALDYIQEKWGNFKLLVRDEDKN